MISRRSFLLQSAGAVASVSALGGLPGAAAEPPIAAPPPPTVVSDDGSGEHRYAIIAIGVQGRRTASSPTAKANGLAKLRWDSVTGADAYLIIRDGKEVTGSLRIEGSQKNWTDKGDR